MQSVSKYSFKKKLIFDEYHGLYPFPASSPPRATIKTMQIIHVDSPEDKRLHAYINLTEVQLRNRLEPDEGIFIAEESPKLLIEL